MRNNKIPYITQYYNMMFDLHNKKIDVDEVPEEQIEKLQDLRDKALEQSGLTLGELWLICMCREYRILTKVNVYARKIKHI